MLGKNVGVRRAKGKFILCTNIDIIFPSKFFEFVQRKKLKKDILYRSERLDIKRTIPQKATIDDQISFAQGNIIRACKRGGTFPTTSRCHRLLLSRRYYFKKCKGLLY